MSRSVKAVTRAILRNESRQENTERKMRFLKEEFNDLKQELKQSEKEAVTKQKGRPAKKRAKNRK